MSLDGKEPLDRLDYLALREPAAPEDLKEDEAHLEHLECQVQKVKRVELVLMDHLDRLAHQDLLDVSSQWILKDSRY